MAKFLKTADDLLSKKSLETITNDYILDEFRNKIDWKVLDGGDAKFLKNDGLSEIRKILDSSNQQLRMYGSAEELAGNLKIYSDFAEAHKHFGIGREPYNSNAKIYKSLKGEDWILKTDLFVILQNMTLRVFPGSNSEQVRLAIATTLKTAENRFSKQIEFVKYDPKVFDEIEKEMQDAEKICYRPSNRKMLEIELASGDFGNFLAKMKMCSMKPKWNEADALKLAKQYYDGLSSIQRAGYMALFLLKMVIAKTLSTIIEKRPEMFRPNSGGPVTVRLFEDGGKRFVMMMEMISMDNRLRAVKADYVCFESEKNEHQIQTYTWEQAHEVFGDQIQNIEFIITPILRAKHRAVPIRAFHSDGGGFCILASDALFDFFKTMIFGVKLFQKYEFPNWQHIIPVLKEHEEFFDSTEKNPFFLRIETVRHLSETLNQMMKMFDFIPIKTNRNAKPDGFTVENLKNELAHLDLTKSMPEIQNYAEDVYSEVVKMRKEKILRTCDLFDAVEHCQLNCIFERLPNFKKFLHNQKGCHRVYGLKCKECEEIQKAPESSKTQKAAKIQKSPKNAQKMSNEDQKAAPEASKASDAPKGGQKKTSGMQKPVQETPESSKIQKSPKPSQKMPEVQKTVQKASESPKIQNSPKPNQKMSEKIQNPLKESQKTSETQKAAQKTPEASKVQNSPKPNQKTSSEVQKTSGNQKAAQKTPEAVKTSEVQKTVQKIPEPSKVQNSPKPSKKTSEKIQKAPESSKTSEIQNLEKELAELKSEHQKYGKMILKMEEKIQNLKN